MTVSGDTVTCLEGRLMHAGEGRVGVGVVRDFDSTCGALHCVIPQWTGGQRLGDDMIDPEVACTMWVVATRGLLDKCGPRTDDLRYTVPWWLSRLQRNQLARQAPAGMLNLGNTCYLNSVLQVGAWGVRFIHNTTCAMLYRDLAFYTPCLPDKAEGGAVAWQRHPIMQPSPRVMCLNGLRRWCCTCRASRPTCAARGWSACGRCCRARACGRGCAPHRTSCRERPSSRGKCHARHIKAAAARAA